MKTSLLCFALTALAFQLTGQAPAIIEWQKTIGGSSYDYLYITIPTPDGGYILGGYSSSGISGDKTEARVGASGTFDFWVVKTDNLGIIQWQNTIGGSNNDYLKAIDITSDGGYILGGYSDSGISGDKSEASLGVTDYWVVKLNSTGSIEWQNTIGGSSTDQLYSIKQTADGGFILGGQSWSGISGDKTEGAYGYGEYWVIKLNSTGGIEWQNTIGGNDTEDLRCVRQTSDGGYLVGGFSWTGINGDKTIANKGNKDYWLLKLSATGTIEWQKAYGGSVHDELYTLEITIDGGILIAGISNSGITGDKTEASIGGSLDYWIIKTDEYGNIQWQNTIGGNANEYLFSVKQMPDKGFIIGGYSNSSLSGDKAEVSQGLNDYWVVRTDSVGVVIWENTIGGAGEDLLYSIYPTADGGFITGGNSASGISGDKTQASKGQDDYWLVKLYFACSPEVCDGIDNDCDGFVDEDLPVFTYYQDYDNDGYGNPSVTATICGPMPAGYSLNNLDCQDYMYYVNPGALEVCDFNDNDCDGLFDLDDPSCEVYPLYIDNDLDGYGWGPVVDYGCYTGGGLSLSNDDCDDNNAAVHWGAYEVCNGIDDDCDYNVDEYLYFYNYYVDEDNDAYGSEIIPPIHSCETLSGYVYYGGDCNDANPNIYPGHDELCNGLDDDCDAVIDDSPVYYTYFLDADGDGFGNAEVNILSCNGTPIGYASNTSDCDDTQLLYLDFDNDGYGTGSPIACGVPYNNDCNDEDPMINPGQIEFCNGIDDECDGTVDNDIINLTYYIDNDHDNYGTDADTVITCMGIPEGYAINAADCDDANSEVNPGMTFEIENGIDDNCDGLTDNEVISNCPNMASLISWQNTIGGVGMEGYGYTEQTEDGGYIFAGYSSSNASGDKTANSKGGSDIWVLKLDATGGIQWQKTIGGSGSDSPRAIHQTNDGGYIIGAQSISPISGDKTEGVIGGGTTNADYWVIKLDSTGIIQWQNTIGGNKQDDLTDLAITPEGGYIITGYSVSGISGDKTEARIGPNPEYEDIWIVKLNSIGAIEWQNTIGGVGSDFAQAIQGTSDGGYIVAADSYSGVSVDKTEPSYGETDYWILKLNGAGSIEWQTTIGGNDYEWITSIIQTTDGGYLMNGGSYSTVSGNKTVPNQTDAAFNEDYFVVKLNPTGVIEWQRTFGGETGDAGSCVLQGPDNSYYIGGFSFSGMIGNKKESSNGNTDIWIIKLDENGDEIWQNAIGGNSSDGMSTMAITSDGGLIVGGDTFSSASGDKTESNIGAYDLWILKLDPPLPQEYYSDADDDGYGYTSPTVVSCKMPVGYATNNTDCNDGNALVNPGQPVETENGIDDNCDGMIDNTGVCVDLPYNVTGQYSFGGSYIDFMENMKLTPDGGFLLGGTSYSAISGNKTVVNKGYADYWLVKTNSQMQIEWQKTYGGDSTDQLKIITLTPDGGYLLAGHSLSDSSGDKSENIVEPEPIVYEDLWLVKTDVNGNIEWENSYGGDSRDLLKCVTPTSDGGYIIGSDSWSWAAGDKTENSNGMYDYWVIKIDAIGNIQWQNNIGGDENDYLTAIFELEDGTFFLAGGSGSSISGDKTIANYSIYSDIWIIQLDASGNILWQNLFGGDLGEMVESVTQTNGGYLFGCVSNSGISNDKTDPTNGGNDFWLVKTDLSGNIIWQHDIGGSADDGIREISETPDGSVVMIGYSMSGISGDKTTPLYNDPGYYSDFWVVKVDTSGSIIWQNSFGGNAGEYPTSQILLPNEGLVIGGWNNSAISGNKTSELFGNYDYWVIRLDPELTTLYYPDLDGDSFGDSNAETESCTPLPGYITTAGDCNDNNFDIHPGSIETCNGIDDDCNGIIDDGTVATTYYADADGDGYGDFSNSILMCETPPAGYVSDASDCNDGNYSVNPSVIEICNLIDDNCDGQIDENLITATITPGGPTTFCNGNSVVLTANSGAGFTYQWFKNNVAVAGGTLSTLLVIKSGSYTVQITIPGGCNSISEPVIITVNPKPKATINVLSDLDLCTAPYIGETRLKANSGAGYTYQWYKNNIILAGAISQTYIATTTGNYKVKVTNASGCFKTSPNVTVTTSCREEEFNSSFEFEIYPNPNSGEFQVSFYADNYSNSEIAIIRICNALGEKIFEDQFSNELLNEQTIQLNDSGSGVYFVQLIFSGTTYSKQVVIIR